MSSDKATAKGSLLGAWLPKEHTARVAEFIQRSNLRSQMPFYATGFWLVRAGRLSCAFLVPFSLTRTKCSPRQRSSGGSWQRPGIGAPAEGPGCPLGGYTRWRAAWTLARGGRDCRSSQLAYAVEWSTQIGLPAAMREERDCDALGVAMIVMIDAKFAVYAEHNNMQKSM